MSLKAVWAPGIAHINFPSLSPQWKAANAAMSDVAARIEKHSFDSLILYSTQWLSVLGTSVQANPKITGEHVDENWYRFGNLNYNLTCDADLSKEIAQQMAGVGLPAKVIHYDHFPIDTGTITVQGILNQRSLPVSVVSSWVYADATKSKLIGQAVANAAKRLGRKPLWVVSSVLSSRYFTKEIDPVQDKISDPQDDEWNQKILSAWESGAFGKEDPKLTALLQQGAERRADMGLNGYHWLAGALGSTSVSGAVRHYGPVWGTGAAVVEFYEN